MPSRSHAAHPPHHPFHRNLRFGSRLTRAALAAVTTAALAAPAAVAAPDLAGDHDSPHFADIAARVADMVSDEAALSLVRRKGLGIVNVMWEDTGRWEGSSVGPNISDVTIEVETPSGNYLMPVIRHDNFTDKTADVRLDRIYVPVGNHAGKRLRTITLADLLAHPTRYLSHADAGKIKGGTLLAKRDSHALVSAQHAFLPVPRDGQATFRPVIFNYQSYQGHPAVLTLLVTRQGTSMTVIDNERDTVDGGASWGQRLFFNQDGKKAPLTAERLRDVQRKGHTANGESAASLGEDANLLMIVQVPLKQAAPSRLATGYGYGAGGMAMAESGAMPAPPGGGAARDRSDVDVAVLGHGDTEGPYTELDNLTIERDPRFPVRVTVQFYQATSNGVVDGADVARMAKQIDKVYAKGDYVGSLVVPGPRDKDRPTRWLGAGPRPAHVTWRSFPGLVVRWQRFGVMAPGPMVAR